MKKYLVWLLVLIAAVSLAACGSGDQQAVNSTEPQQETVASTQVPTQPTTAPTEGTTEPTTAPTEGTTEPTTCSHNWSEASCEAPKTCTVCGETDGDALGHKEVILPAKLATFSNPGLTEGSSCETCGKTIKEQKQIPALGSDVAVGTDYYDQTGKTTYRYSYSFTLYEGDRFNLTTLKVGSDESYSLTSEEGKINYLDNGVYELIFDSGKEKMYGKIVDNQFQFCNEDGSKWKDKETKPQGTTTTNITPRHGNSVYGYKDLANNDHGKAMQELYYRMFAACEAFIDSKKDVAAVDGNYIIDRINLDYYVLTADEAVAVWKVFYVENPRYYWLANSLDLTGGVMNVCIDKAYASGAYRQQCDAAIDNLAAGCKQELKSGMDQLQKALTIHDFILNQMNYAYKKSGVPETAIWAHNLIGCAEKAAGVCESYAKAYQYLCRLNGLECLVVTGYNQENHAWNVVKIDGKWYGVDCTFDETNKNTLSYNCFGMSEDRMNEGYEKNTPNDDGVNYLYRIPELAEQGIELVELYKNGNYMGQYANIDTAFKAMTDTKGDYELRLFNYSFRGVLLLGSTAVEHSISSTQTPKVKSLTITGSHIDLGDDYYTCTYIKLNKKLSLQSNLTLSNIAMYGSGTLDLKNKTLICRKSIQFNIPITGSTSASSPSTIKLAAGSGTAFYCSVKIHTLTKESGFPSAALRADSEIEKVELFQFDVYDFNDESVGPISVHIKEFCPKGIDTHAIHIHGPARVTIDKINITTEDNVGMSVVLRFGRLEEFPKLTLGKSNSHIDISLDGEIAYIMTDVNGEVVEEWTESVNPDNLKEPIATLKDPKLMSDISVYFMNWEPEIDADGHAIWPEFELNSKNQIVRKK